MHVSKNCGTLQETVFDLWRPVNNVSMHPHVEFLITEAVLKHPEKTLAISQREYDFELLLFFSSKTRKQIFTVEVEFMLVVANLPF